MVITGETYRFPPYPEMVRNLFKKDLPGNHALLLHAALGIAGEGAELKKVHSRKNFIEECGDIEFYMQAAHNVLDDQNKPYMYPVHMPLPDINLGTWSDVVQTAGGEMIDFVKKAWVYGNREPNFAGVHVVLRDLREALDFAYELHGTDRHQVCFQNQVKLIGNDGRYKSGKYSDEAALAREDKKASGEEPHEHQPRFAASTEVQGSSIRPVREEQSIGASDVGSLSAVIGQIEKKD